MWCVVYGCPGLTMPVMLRSRDRNFSLTEFLPKEFSAKQFSPNGIFAKRNFRLTEFSPNKLNYMFSKVSLRIYTFFHILGLGCHHWGGKTSPSQGALTDQKLENKNLFTLTFIPQLLIHSLVSMSVPPHIVLAF